MQEMQETRVRSLGGENSMEEEMATHSSILAWRIPWTEEPGELQFMGLQRDSIRTQSCPSLLLTQFSFPSFLQQLLSRFYVLRQGSFYRVTVEKKNLQCTPSPCHYFHSSPAPGVLWFEGCPPHNLLSNSKSNSNLIQHLVHFPVTSVVYIWMTVKASSY